MLQKLMWKDITERMLSTIPGIQDGDVNVFTGFTFTIQVDELLNISTIDSFPFSLKI